MPNALILYKNVFEGLSIKGCSRRGDVWETGMEEEMEGEQEQENKEHKEEKEQKEEQEKYVLLLLPV